MDKWKKGLSLEVLIVIFVVIYKQALISILKLLRSNLLKIIFYSVIKNAGFSKLQDLEYLQRQDCIVVTVDETTKKLNFSLPKDLSKKGLKKNTANILLPPLL